MWQLIIATSGILAYWLIEHYRLARARNRLRIRIHVNGTRGKSSTTRLIAAALRAGGIRTYAKVTGTLPVFIYEDGTERFIPRPGTRDFREHGLPNINEYIKVIRAAAMLGGEALVSECMALRPDLQWTAEHMMMRSTIGVITNVRRDHLDVMGPTVRDVALAFAATIPQNGHLVTAEREYLSIFEKVASERNTTVHYVSGDSVSDSIMHGFSYIEHADNVAIALKVAELVGVPRDIAVKGMHSARPDPGALRILDVEERGKTIHFVSAFAANDPDSFRLIWKAVRPRFDRWIVIMNCREDRIERSIQLGELFVEEMSDVDAVIVTGRMTSPFIDVVRDSGVFSGQIIDCEGCSVEEVYSKLFDVARDGSGVFGMGNMVPFGEMLTEYIKERAKNAG